MKFRIAFSLLNAALVTQLGACAVGDKLAQVGMAPPLSPINVPLVAPPVSGSGIAYVPSPTNETHNANSLWQPGARSFFRDPRASRVGDILTVNITIGDEAKIDNSTSRSRNSSEKSDLTNLLGIESQLAHVFPEAIDPANLTKFGSDSSTVGTGSVNRSEDIKLTVAAVVRQILPNGNLMIEGQQEVRVNNEVRELLVSGIVRPEDITNANTISHTQIAEARISYGGRGQITDFQQPALGQQVYNILWPF